ncbi:MAG TPA: two-component regulator propeller domain-containing protein [Parafilimonas sp.]|nr:two-component regulator propeller domain-containing protein [Parafilimonas sp.]
MLLFLITFKLCAQQQNYVFHHLTSKDGLGSEYIQSIFQDSKGFYWIGTTSGLQKFDGYTFSKPLIAGNDLLPSPYVTETKDGTIWISNGNSLYRYNRTTEKFMPMVPEGKKPKMSLKIIEDGSGNKWLLNNQFIYKYDAPSAKLITWMKLPDTDPAMTAGAFTFSKKDNLIWIQNGITLYKISPLEKKIINEEKMPYQAACLWKDGDYLWMSFWTQHLCRWNTITGKKDWFFIPIEIKGTKTLGYAVASCFARDRNGKLWIGTIDGGLWYFEEPANKLIHINSDNLKFESLHFNELVYCITIDKAGSIWVGSDRGVNIFDPSYQRFYAINNTDLPTKGITSFINKKPFETSSGDILVSTLYGGWLHYDNHFKLRRSFTVILNNTSSYIDACKNIVTCFAEDKKGKIWIGHPGGLVGIYDGETGSIKYSLIPEFKRCNISSIQCDTMGNMWFTLRASRNNLVKWDIDRHRYIVYNDSLLVDRGEQESSLMITKQNAIWVQTFNNGIYRFDPVQEKIAEIYRGEQQPFNIPDAVQGISSLNDSVIAIASYAKGFFFLNTNQKTTAALNTDDGLPSNIVKAIATDKESNLWITTLSDLVKMNPQTKKIVSFDEEDGVLSKGFHPGFTRLRDGRLIIASTTGLLYFHPDSVKTQPPPPDVLLTGLKISGKPVLLDSALNAGNNKIRLPYDKNFLTIDYVSISYLNRKTTQYFYKLEGLEKDWINAGTQRVAAYTNLSPCKYTFMVRCENRDGVFSKNITYLSIIISPPLWATWWAYSLYALIAVSIVYVLYRNRIRALSKNQAAQIKAIVATQEEERKRIARDLHDDVGTKLSTLKLFLSSLHEKATNTNNEQIRSLTESSEQFITEAMKDVRQLLLNLSPTVLEEFGYTTAVEGLVNKINGTNQIRFDLVIFGIDNRLQKDYELALYRITQELINNVLKHAEAKHVSLQIGRRDEKIILMMEDDGKGFDVHAHKTGYGLQNLDARSKLMHGMMTLDSHLGKGTSVLIEIPYNFNGQ